MSDDSKMMRLLKFCEENEIQVALWTGPSGQRFIGVPKFEGFDIDIGEMFTVGGLSVALHDFKTLQVVNPEHYANRGVRL